MKKEEELHEIEKVLCPNGHEYREWGCGCYCVLRCNSFAEKLYAAGYRKADDVRKETAKEVLDEIGKQNIGLDMENEEMLVRDTNWFKALCKRYAMADEVDE